MDVYKSIQAIQGTLIYGILNK